MHPLVSHVPVPAVEVSEVEGLLRSGPPDLVIAAMKLICDAEPTGQAARGESLSGALSD